MPSVLNPIFNKYLLQNLLIMTIIFSSLHAYSTPPTEFDDIIPRWMYFEYSEAPLNLLSGATVTFFHVEKANNIVPEAGIVILFHGLGFTGEYYKPLAMLFAVSGYDVYAVNQFGYTGSFCASEAESPYSLMTYVKEVPDMLLQIERRYAQAYNIQPKEIILWGQSMGGAVITKSSQLFPEAFARCSLIVLEAPAYKQAISTFAALGCKESWLMKYNPVVDIAQKINAWYHLNSRLPGSYADRFFQMPTRFGMDKPEVFVQNSESLISDDNKYEPDLISPEIRAKMVWLCSPFDEQVSFSNIERLHRETPEPRPKLKHICGQHVISLARPELSFRIVMGRWPSESRQ